VEVIIPHAGQALGVVYDAKAGVRLLLQRGGGYWQAVAGLKNASDDIMSIPGGFSLDPAIERRLDDALNAVHDEVEVRGAGIALSTTRMEIVTA
jgi:hypothetical protein